MTALLVLALGCALVAIGSGVGAYRAHSAVRDGLAGTLANLSLVTAGACGGALAALWIGAPS